MSETNIERYRAAAAKWRQEASEASTEEERKSCLVLAEGYEHLIRILTEAATPGDAT